MSRRSLFILTEIKQQRAQSKPSRAELWKKIKRYGVIAFVSAGLLLALFIHFFGDVPDGAPKVAFMAAFIGFSLWPH